MCGIAGVFNYKNQKQISQPVLKKMCDVIRHRGPDAEGFYLDESMRVGFGHRRLSIIDLEGGIQPMSNAAEDVWIIFNGEIYNYPELKSELTAKGYKFRTKSDTEVIIHLYKEYGVAAFDRLNGIFAFAIHDKKNRCVVLARDHFGVKPVYYWMGGGSVVFSSEIKAILEEGSVPKALDEEALDTFLTLRYNPAPQTMFKGIKKLHPGHYLKIDVDGNFELKDFTTSRPKILTNISEVDAVSEYRRLLEAAVRRQLLSDVPVGLFLSGGVDSAVLGYLMQKNYSKKIKTFTIGFPGSGDYNELDDARVSAKFIGSEHHEITLSQTDYMDFFNMSFRSTEEPIAETTISALYYVSKLAAGHLKVVLAGQGADEPMAGYPRYLGAHFIGKYSKILRMLPLKTLSNVISRNESFKRAAYVSRFSDELDRMMAIYTIFTPEQKKLLYGNRAPSTLPAGASKDGRATKKILERLYSETKELPDFLSKILYVDTRMSLPDDLLLFNDKITMANSLEMRVPFLDTELMRFIESLPSSLKLKGTQRKYIHKKAVEPWLPKEIIYRKKRGFMTPMDQWLQKDMASDVQKILEQKDSACRKYFDIEAVCRMIGLHRSRRENYQKHIFALLSFELWHRTFFDD